MSSPLNFILSSITQAKHQGKDRWRAVLRCAWMPQRHMQLWFDEEAQARKLPQGSVGVPEIMGLFLEGTQSLRCSGIIQEPPFFKRNLWTGRVEKEASWSAGFVPSQNEAGVQGMDLVYPTYPESSTWKPNFNYTLPTFINQIAPPQTTALFLCMITLANSEAQDFAAADVVSVVTQAAFGVADLLIPQLTFDDSTGTLTIGGTLPLSKVFNSGGAAQASTEASGNIVTLYSAQGGGNLWDIVGPWSPATVMGLLQPQIAPYPAAYYVAEFQGTGFFDRYGYHPPGFYDAGDFTGGFDWINGQFLTGASLLEANPGASYILGVDAIMQSVSSAGVLAITVNGNLNGEIVPGYNAGQIQFQEF
jgi:hypothetical protein